MALPRASGVTIARAAAVVLALVVCAWFALGIRQAHDTNKAAAIISGAGALSASESARAASLLRAAGTLNPDSQVDMLRAGLALLNNDRPLAKRTLEDVVRREPMNATAWFQLIRAAAGDVPTQGFAMVHLVRLDPVVR